MAIMQSMYDQVVDHLRQQNSTCEVEGRCRYRYNGKKCAVGCLITDEEYDSWMEGCDLETLLADPKAPSSLTSKFYGDFKALMITMQMVHDTHDPDKWEEMFQAVAKLYGLQYKPRPLSQEELMQQVSKL